MAHGNVGLSSIFNRETSSEKKWRTLSVIKYLLDTNVVSELRKLKPHGAVVAWLKTLRSDQIFISAVTMGELQAGIELTRKNDEGKALEIEAWLDVLESSFTALPMNSPCFRECARLMVGKSADLFEDAMIAATAHVHGLYVATRNEQAFRALQIPTFNPFRFS